MFNPAERLSAAEALAHPYVSQFHQPADEPDAACVITIPIDDNTKARAPDPARRVAGGAGGPARGAHGARARCAAGPGTVPRKRQPRARSRPCSGGAHSRVWVAAGRCERPWSGAHGGEGCGVQCGKHACSPPDT